MQSLIKVKTQSVPVKLVNNQNPRAKCFGLLCLILFLGHFNGVTQVAADKKGSSGLPTPLSAVVKAELSPMVVDKESGAAYPLAIGSGLEYEKTVGGEHFFWGVTDRGPNGKGPKIAGERLTVSAVFPAPDYQPRAVLIALSKDFKRARLVRELPLSLVVEGETKAASGLVPPFPRGVVGEQGLSPQLSDLPTHLAGIDPEGVAIGKDGMLWIAEEYYPSIMQVDPNTGVVKRLLRPGAGLPALLASRTVNRGLEGLTITPAGRIVAAMQSGLEHEKNSPFSRLLVIDAALSKNNFVLLPHTEKEEPDEVKIGGITTVSENVFLYIRTLPGKKGAELVLADITNATLLGEVSSAAEIAAATSAITTTLLELKDIDWDYKKTEGIALMPDGKTVMIIADNDFGTEVVLKVDPEDSILNARGVVEIPQPELEIKVKEKTTTPIWTLVFKKDLVSYLKK